ncbi:MAG: hypothetical protein QUT30_17550, partial [Acidobacteriota bacterium]|nr:hypothetical protein [Acidobacteriota bacterium]
GAWASASLALLDDAPTSPASRRLASAHAALGTRHILILGHAPIGWFLGNVTMEDPFRRVEISTIPSVGTPGCGASDFSCAAIMKEYK